MSCGQKAWAEKLEEELWEESLQRFRNHPEGKVIETINRSIDELVRLVASDPSLTRIQWARLDSALKELKSLI